MAQGWIRSVLSVSLVLAGCQSPVSLQQTSTVAAVVPTMTIDAIRALDALGDRPNALWQDALFTTKAVQERRKTSRYRVQAATAGNTWPSPANLPSTSTNGIAYAHHDTSFGDQGTHPRDLIWAVCDNGTVAKIRATDGTLLTSFNALAGITGDSITDSALVLSGKNDRIYLLTTAGRFIMLDAETGAQLSVVQVSRAGFKGIAPFIDYSNGGGTPGQFDDEYVYALARDGSLYQLRCTPTSVAYRGWRGTTSGASTDNGYTVPTTGVRGTYPATGSVSNSLAYGNAVLNRCVAAPSVWGGNAYFGGSDGSLFRVRTAASALDSVSVSAWPIASTPAIEWDDFMTTVTDVFVPAGDRLHWVDSSSAGALTRKAVSPPLVLNTKPASGASGASGILSNYTYGGTLVKMTTTPYSSTDWIAAATQNVPNAQGPTSWGDSTQRALATVNMGSLAYEAKVAPDGKIWSPIQAQNAVKILDPETLSVTETYTGDGNYASLVKTIPVGTTPAGLASDPLSGGVWVANFNSDSITQLDKDGNVVRTFIGVTKPTAIAYDQRSTPGVADDVLWVASATGSLAGATGALLRVAVSNGAVTSFGPADTLSTGNTATSAKSYNAMGGAPANNLPATGTKTYSALTTTNWAFRGPQGVVVTSTGEVWVANSLQNTSLSAQNSGRTPIYPFQLDGTGAGGTQDGIDGEKSSIMVFDPATSKFTARIVTTGSPFGMAFSTQGTGSVWIGTYRWGQDVVERYDQRSSANYARLFRSNQTTNHWQPRFVAVDDANNRVWVVNANSNENDPVAQNGLDAVRATATGTANMSGGAPFIGTYKTGGQPRGVAVDSTGSVWVANNTQKNVIRYQGNGTPVGTYPVGALPYAVEVDKFDVAWVTNQNDGTVSRVPGDALPPDLFSNPRGLAFDKNANAWVANFSDNKVRILNQNGNHVLAGVLTGSQPEGVASRDGRTWVAGTGDNNVQMIDIVTGGVTSFPLGGTSTRVDIDAAGNAFFASGNFIRKITPTGTVTSITANTTRDVAIHPTTNDLWAAVGGSNELWRFNSGATTVTNKYAGLTNIWGVAAKGNHVWASSTTAGLTRFNAVTATGRAGIGTNLGTVPLWTNANQPKFMDIDAYGNVWVANGTGNFISKIWSAGNTDLMAAQHYQGTDGNGSYAYARFNVTKGSFGGRTPVRANLLLKPLSNSARTDEAIRTWAVPNFITGTTLWTGVKGGSNVAWNNHPTRLTALTDVEPTVPMTAGNTFQVRAKVYSELHDASAGSWDSNNGNASYAFRSENVALADVAHIDTSATGGVQLEVYGTSTRIEPAKEGLRSRPTIDSQNKRIYMMGSNAVFELRFDSPANFADASKIAYSYSQNGITGGPTRTGDYYITPAGATALTFSGKLLTLDYSASSNQSTLNAYNVNWQGSPPFGGGQFYLDVSGNNTSQHTTTASVPGEVYSNQLTYDYDRGSVYVVNGNKLMGLRMLQ